MSIIKADIGNWHIECFPEDGARISKLLHAGINLLNPALPGFKPPEKFYGEYETRPVYGYDDCFPTVDVCSFPERESECRDHGELCWLKWQLQVKDNRLICTTECPRPRVSFSRILEFEGNNLTWRFEVFNKSAKRVPFLHVMHALLPLGSIRSVTLPEFNVLFDEIGSADLIRKSPQELADDLIITQNGEHRMLLLKEISSGLVQILFKQDLLLSISFDTKMFPVLGIWWNNGSYPEEDGLKRSECAFEPIPGTCSDLSKSYTDGRSLVAEPDVTITWEIHWNVEKVNSKQ